MPSYQIRYAEADRVYCDVIRDNGQTFGQFVYGEARKTLAGIDAAIAAAVTSLEAVEPPMDAAVVSAIQSSAVMTIADTIAPVTPVQ